MGRLAPRAAALVAGALAAGLLPSAGGADTAPTLAAQSAALRAHRAALTRTEHGALLELYAAEAGLARARGELSRLDARSLALAREESSARRRTEIVRRSLATTHRRIATTLRALYVEGEIDPLAVVLGASSLDEVLTGIESLERATAQNQRLAADARGRADRLATLQARLAARRAQLDVAHAAAAASSSRLAGAVAARRASVAEVRRRGELTARRVTRLLALARAAERRSARIARTAALPAAAPEAPDRNEEEPTETTESTETTETAETAEPTEPREPAADTSPAVPASPVAESGTRTLVVDAVAYHLPGRTASGLPVGLGVVAVDPRVIPLGTRLFIPGYGAGVAADVGSAVKGNIIDVWMPSTADARRWGRRTVTITVYG